MTSIDISQIKVIFLDIGGVLLTNGWGHVSRQKAASHFGFNYDEMNVLHHFIYNVFEIGSISLDEYLDIAVFHRRRDFTKAEFKNFMYAQSVELPKMLPWLKSWKKQITIPVFALVQVKPQECLYFDDRLMLANTATKLGMNGIHHETFETSKKILEKFICK